ncbi:dihydrolipoyl dehydrogenase family protein [Oceanidesulfovibrio marinus]|nr:NAD(P)/FAD-dependent oxidoreductase [Oceanidesulfovibrio marinus]
MPDHYDALILGAGPAGGGVASRLAKAGLNVAMTDSGPYGGTCPLTGCNPKKVLLGPADLSQMAAHMKGKGIICKPSVNWQELMAFKRTFTEPIPERAFKAYSQEGVTTLTGGGRFTGPDSVEIDGRELTADNIFICTGVRARPLSFPGAEHLIDNAGFLDMDELPEHIVLVGGGYIAMEFAAIAHYCGARVTVLQRSDAILRGFDNELSGLLMQAMRDAGITLLLNAPVQFVDKNGGRLRVCYGEEGNESVIADAVVNCAGRVPNIETLNLEAAGVETGPKGVQVKPTMQSVSNPKVWAVGDVADTPYELTPTAVLEAEVAVANVLDPAANREADYTGIPTSCFTLPPLAACGLTVAQAAKQGIPHTVITQDLPSKFPWKRLGEQYGRSKVILDANREYILGAHILGHNAEEMINLFAMAIRNRISLDTLHSTYWAYPTCGYYIQYLVKE